MNLAGRRDGSSEEHLQRMLLALEQAPLSPEQARQLGVYLKLLLRWNAKMNLTAIRAEDDILRRHFVESILCARLLPEKIHTLLDYGSGAGFPGVPCAICRPELQVTLAESQTKKAMFLREAVRSLGLHASVHHGRAGSMEREAPFDAVTMRAVDRMRDACVDALTWVKTGGWLAILTTEESSNALIERVSGVAWSRPVRLPGTDQQILLLGRKLHAPAPDCSTWNNQTSGT